ncbi:hypothetical protein F5144DRAFT_656639 [Chaetomium tenue]|uniref:Uncharacterized protein n=1 Tax=Chaetomium tenue TaxID=1854479 RepID=A0ACB7NWW5_9PEZI|nr:hypothetical protein F5144DRAFT_656639 [Chaetomium globosum]
MNSETAATHEEIWDDSALVDSWNEALEEYKVSERPVSKPRQLHVTKVGLETLTQSQKYHSIHAKGGTVDDILGRADEMTSANADAKPETGELNEPIAEGEDEGEVDETISMDESDETSHPIISDVQGSGDAKKADGMAPASGPEAFLGTVPRLTVAGYYTGLYEGKQQGNQQTKGGGSKGP